MYRTFDTANGIPPRIYRSPEEIRRDIRNISVRIQETSSMLNIRELLINILTSERADKPEKLIPILEQTVEEARCALDTLSRLKDELTMLEEELREVRWLLGI